MKEKGFWKKFSARLDKQFFKLVDRLFEWFNAILDWLQDLAKDVAKEANMHILWIAVFSFGAVIYLFEKRIPIDETHHFYLSRAGIGISLWSTVMLVISMLRSLLNSLGLLEPLRKFRDTILNKLNLL